MDRLLGTRPGGPATVVCLSYPTGSTASDNKTPLHNNNNNHNNEQVDMVNIKSRHLLLWAGAFAAGEAALDGPNHQQNVCAMYGNCGKKSLFGSELPCPSTTPAKEPDDETKNALVEVCGKEWADTAVCCDLDQVQNLKQNLKKAESIIASCPACKENFFQFFCKFTCSPDQSTFVNVSKTGKSTSKKDIVTELDQYVDPSTAAKFYDSCKEVKFSATNGYAMDFIGGGAKNYKEFFKFLGDEKPLLGGSPFQMNFPWDNVPSEITPASGGMHNCYDKGYKCACTDCSKSCPQLPKVDGVQECKVGAIPCLSFAMLIVYTGSLVLLVVGYGSWIAYKNQKARNLEARRLLYDSETEQEEDDYYSPRLGMYRLANTDRLKSPYKLNTNLQAMFSSLALKCAKYPFTVIASSIVIVGVLMVGLLRLELETSPVRLWVSPSSREFAEKEFFDQKFGPFYRSEQVYLINDTGPVMDYETLEWWFDVESQVGQLETNDGTKLQHLCLNPGGDACVVQSVTQYFSGDINQLPESQWDKKIEYCANNPVECLPPFQQPLDKALLFGGYNKKVTDAKALVATWVLNNDNNDDKDARAASWERELETLLVHVQKQARERGLRLSFNTEMSLEKELNKSSNTDAKIIIVSYIVMFLYASIALGGVIPGLGKRSIVKSKFSLGFFGILIVLLSVASSVGVFAALGVKATLIIAEVIPFLVLAVGVDNIFLLTHELDNVNISYPNETIEERVSRAVGHIGPSILLSASCETLTFALGGFVEMPAVRNFAIYSAGAVFFNALLQLTTFVSALTLDQKRVEQNRVDFFPFWRLDANGKTANARESFTAQARVLGSPGVFEKFTEPMFGKLVRKYYAPYIVRRKVKVGVIVAFVTWLFVSVALLPEVELGLDQRLAVPNDSYLVDYFDDLYNYFESGPPVYFVTKDMNATDRSTQRELCGRFSGCEQYSLVNIIEQERKRPQVSYIDKSASSWIDDFLQWLNPNLECCRFKKGSNKTLFCKPGDLERRCEPCFGDRPYESSMEGLPQGDEFMQFFKEWINAPSDVDCPLGGKAPYGSELAWDNSTVYASKFRSSHVPLRSQDDFIQAYASARRVADLVEAKTGVETFPYSNFYIFFAQYHTIVRDAMALVGSALAVIFVLSTILLGSIKTSILLTTTVLSAVVNIAGAMSLFGIGFNAVSLVNLVICVGIGVEFCVHIARAFTFTTRGAGHKTSKSNRCFNALVGVGGDVLGGIVLTKLIGVSVLAFTHSKIFDVYYFRMWLLLVVVGALHCFVLLPVLLSWGGGRGYVIDQDDEGVISDLASRVVGYDQGEEHDDDYDSE